MNVVSRNDLPILLNELDLKGWGVEIGVETGHYSEVILVNSNLTKLFSVDPWARQPKEVYNDISNESNIVQYERYLGTVRKLLRFNMRSVCLRMFSSEAVSLFQNNSLDFIYIDGNHAFDVVREDLNIWYPKLKQGGVFAGHDYMDGKIIVRGYVMDFGVKSAVDSFVDAQGVQLNITQEEFPSWYFVK